MTNNIKPEHYRKGEIDLYEAFSKIFPHNEYRAGMQMIAMRYMFRDKDNRIQDLDKAIYTLERLKEKESEYNAEQERIEANKILQKEYESISDQQTKGIEKYANMGYSISQIATMYDLSEDVVGLKINELKWDHNK